MVLKFFEEKVMLFIEEDCRFISVVVAHPEFERLMYNYFGWINNFNDFELEDAASLAFKPSIIGWKSFSEML